MTDPATLLTRAQLAPQAFCAHHEELLRLCGEILDCMQPAPRAPLGGRGPVASADHDRGASGRRAGAKRASRQAVGAWMVDSATSRITADAAASRTDAARLPRARLSDALAHPEDAPLVAMVRHAAREPALASDTLGANPQRHTALPAAHDELLALAMTRKRGGRSSPACKPPPRGSRTR